MLDITDTCNYWTWCPFVILPDCDVCFSILCILLYASTVYLSIPPLYTSLDHFVPQKCTQLWCALISSNVLFFPIYIVEYYIQSSTLYDQLVLRYKSRSPNPTSLIYEMLFVISQLKLICVQCWIPLERNFLGITLQINLYKVFIHPHFHSEA